jgi:uncharacterized GH25 family protein
MNSIVKAGVISLVLIVVFVVAAFLFSGKKPKVEPGAEPTNTEATEVSSKAEKEKRPSKKIEGPKTPDVSFGVQVLDGATMKLLPKATLAVLKISDGDRPGEAVFESGRSSGGTGEFVVKVPPGAYQIRAQCPSYASAMRRVTILKETSELIAIELSRGNSISGRIADKGGRGIGGAIVRAYYQISDPKASQIENLLKIIELPKRSNEPPAETVSAADGSYQIDGLEKIYYTVKAIAAGFSPGEKGDILPTKDNVNFTLAAGGIVTGTVVDSGSGGGIEGAKVMAYTHVDTSDLFTIIQARARPALDTVTTGAGGTFEFRSLGVGSYNFVASARGYQEGKFLKVRVQSGENPPLRFPLPRGLSISGSVISSGGEAIQGAKIRVSRTGGEAGRTEQMFIKFDDGSILSDAQGKFSFDTLEPGKYILLAWHPDHATEQMRDIEAGTENLTVTLPMGGAVSGQVTEAGTGKAIAGARISVSDMQDLRKEGVSDDQGMFEIRGLNSTSGGKKFLNIHAEGYARLSNVQIFVEEGRITENQNFELHPTAVVSGRVVNKSGGGVANARVMAQRKGTTAGVAMTVGSASTDSQGRFGIKDLEAGEETQVKVMTGEYLEGLSEPFTVQPGQSLELPDILLLLGGEIRGRVVAPDGKGIAGAQVSVQEEGKTSPDLALGGSSESDGTFVVRGLPSGTVDLVAKHNHYLDEVVKGVKVSEGIITPDVRMVMKQGGVVRGRVLDPDGQPVANAQVTGKDLSASGMKELRATTEQDGSFVIENILSDDKIEIEVEHNDFGSWGKEVPVNTADLEVALSRLGGIRAVVVDAAGKAVPSFTVQPIAKASDAKRLPAKSYSATPNGAFEYTGILAGVYDVNVRAPGYSVFTFKDIQVGPQVGDLGQAMLQEGGTIAGTVMDASGRPVFQATVRVVGGLSKFSPSADRPQSDQSTVLTDARGAFEFRNLKGGPVTLNVTAKGYVNQKVENIDPNYSNARLIAVTLDVGSEIVGSVVDSAGNVKSGVSIYLRSSERPDLNQRTATNSEGQFKFSGLAAGNYTVTAQALGAPPGQNASVEVPLGAGVEQPVELQVN